MGGIGFLLFLFVSMVFSQSSQVAVKINSGTVLGNCEQLACSFLGIPYAGDVAGANRWTAPIPVLPWKNTFNATSYGPICPQKYPWPPPDPTTLISNENCLNLNVWTPSDFNPSNPAFPVIVWIHGGAFIQGTGADPLYIGQFFANTTGTIVVTINYRLGALGWFNSVNNNITGNYGLLDQQLALKWVQDNIANFGGNSSKVTIMGQSAGAMSVMLHLTMPSSWGLFSSAILESNLASVLYRYPSENQEYANKLAKHLKCELSNGTINMTCMYEAPVNEIIKEDLGREYIITIPVKTTEYFPWSPVIDGVLLPAAPLSSIQQGKLRTNTNILLGTVRNETSRFIPDIEIGTLVYESLVKAIYSSNASLVLNMYPPLGKTSRNQLDILTTDYLFVCPDISVAAINAKLGASTFVYQFFYPPPDDPVNHANPGCATVPCHSAEIPFVFHSQLFAANTTWTAAEFNLSNVMLNFWANFASGNFSDDGIFSKDLNLYWPKYLPATNESLVFDIPSSNLTSNFRQEYCSFWNSMGYIY